jgi:hypothetical protein
MGLHSGAPLYEGSTLRELSSKGGLLYGGSTLRGLHFKGAQL